VAVHKTRCINVADARAQGQAVALSVAECFNSCSPSIMLNTLS
jgi:hypothetical protein